MNAMLKIHNSLTRQKEIFTPRVPGKVGMYVCGMTVYDYCHVGHARVMVVFDVVARYLRASGFDVAYVRTVAAVDDKILKRVGDHFDIHAGGADLMFPHHENEIAQSEAATGHHFVNYWMHNGFVQINEEKMAKSLGNFFTVRDVLDHYPPEVIRYFILSSHYRSPLNYSKENLERAKTVLDRYYTALRDVPLGAAAGDVEHSDYAARFNAAMDDDFNTPEAIAVLFDLVSVLNSAKAKQQMRETENLGGLLRQLGGTLGILQDNPDDFLKRKGWNVTVALTGIGATLSQGKVSIHVSKSDEEINTIIAKRLAARKAKIWKESDRIREELKAHGGILEDGPQGTTWRRA